MVLSNNGHFNVSDFSDYDLVMLGDIHKMHFLNEEKTIAYSGSLIQQNKGESIEKGYLLWDIKKLSSEFVRIHNDYGMVKIVINKNGKWKEPQKIDIPKYAKLDIVCNSEDNADIESVYKYFDENGSIVLEKNAVFENKKNKLDNIIIKGQKNNINFLTDKPKLIEFIYDCLDKSKSLFILDVLNEISYWDFRFMNLTNISTQLENSELQRIIDILEKHGVDNPGIRSISDRLLEINEQINKLEVTLASLEEEDDPVLTISDADVAAATASLRSLLASEGFNAIYKHFCAMHIVTEHIEASASWRQQNCIAFHRNLISLFNRIF